MLQMQLWFHLIAHISGQKLPLCCGSKVKLPVSDAKEGLQSLGLPLVMSQERSSNASCLCTLAYHSFTQLSMLQLPDLPAPVVSTDLAT